MSDSHRPVTTVSSTVAPFQGGGIVQQSHSAAANATDVAASTSTAISVPGGSGTSSTAAAASGGNVVAIQTTATEKDTTTRVNIDEDPRAKLMFYLDCISCVFDDFYTLCMEILKEQSISKIDCLLKYKNYRALTVKQCDEVLILCDVLRPSLFNNKCIFANAQKCGNLTNRFFKLEEVEKSLAIQNEIIVRGEKRHVKKIMYYDTLYLEKNYFKPMRCLEHRLKVIRQGRYLDSETFTENYKVHLLLTIIFPFWVVVWVAMCLHEGDPSKIPEEQTEP